MFLLLLQENYVHAVTLWRRQSTLFDFHRYVIWRSPFCSSPWFSWFISDNPEARLFTYDSEVTFPLSGNGLEAHGDLIYHSVHWLELQQYLIINDNSNQYIHLFECFKVMILASLFVSARKRIENKRRQIYFSKCISNHKVLLQLTSCIS